MNIVRRYFAPMNNVIHLTTRLGRSLCAVASA
jgi:hypothetical protein